MEPRGGELERPAEKESGEEGGEEGKSGGLSERGTNNVAVEIDEEEERAETDVELEEEEDDEDLESIAKVSCSTFVFTERGTAGEEAALVELVEIAATLGFRKAEGGANRFPNKLNSVEDNEVDAAEERGGKSS